MELEGDLANRTASAIEEGFAAYHEEFKRITHGAKGRFERCEWRQLHEDADQRLDLYKCYVDRTVRCVKDESGAPADDRGFWAGVKQQYTQFSAHRDDFDLAESFY